MRNDDSHTSIRASRHLVQQLKALRDRMQELQPYGGRLSMEAALGFALASTTEAVVAEQRSRDSP